MVIENRWNNWLNFISLLNYLLIINELDQFLFYNKYANHDEILIHQ